MPMVNITVCCIHCDSIHNVEVESSGYAQWIQGIHIQKAMPNLSTDKRELLISQTCNECWDRMFSEDDDADKIPFDQDPGDELPY